MAATKAEGFLQKIDPQMWITLIGFVFTLGLIYGEFQIWVIDLGLGQTASVT